MLSSSEGSRRNLLVAFTALLVCAAVFVLFRSGAHPQSAWLALGLVPTALLAGRSVKRRSRKTTSEEPLTRHQAVFVGVNPTTLAAFERLKQTSPNTDVIGFIDEPERRRRDLPYLGDFDTFDAVLRSCVIDAVYVGLPMRSHFDTLSKIIASCETHGVNVHYLLDMFPARKGSGTKLRVVDGVPTLMLHTAPTSGWQLSLKHAFDRVSAAIALLLISPVLLVAAIAIKLEDGGPVFFTQERVGFNKRLFRMIKLRSMVVNAEALMKELEAKNERDGAAFKLANDPRVSRVGRVLRKYSIDELPQLINVLLGEMSVVGPRPLSLRDYGLMPEDWQRRRFSIRPGLTCYWQVRGRHNTTFLEWMKLDLEYIDNWSLYEDFKVIFQTVPELLKGGGA